MRAFRQGLSTHRPAGVGDHVQTGIGVPQELGSSCRLHGKRPGWGYRVTNPRPAAPRWVAAGETLARPTQPWYRQTKATKCGGRGGRKSQCLGSTEESGELGPRGPGGWEARQRVTAGCSDRIQGKRRIAPARRHSGGHPGVAWPWPSADHSARKACDSRPPRGIFSPQTLDRG